MQAADAVDLEAPRPTRRQLGRQIVESIVAEDRPAVVLRPGQEPLVLAEDEERVGLFHVEEDVGRGGAAPDHLLLEVVDGHPLEDDVGVLGRLAVRPDGVQDDAAPLVVNRLGVDSCGSRCGQEAFYRVAESYDGFPLGILLRHVEFLQCQLNSGARELGRCCRTPSRRRWRGWARSRGLTASRWKASW